MNLKLIKLIKIFCNQPKKKKININLILIIKNGGKYEDNIKFKVYKTNKNQKFIITRNNQEKKIGTNESNNNSNLTASKEGDIKKNINIKIDFEKYKKGNTYKNISLKDNNNKEKYNKEEEIFEYNNIAEKHINYTDRGNRIICNINKKRNDLVESSSSFLESSDSRNKDTNSKKVSTKRNSINKQETINTQDINSNNKRKKNNKSKNYRDEFNNLGSNNDIQRWNTIQIKSSPKNKKIKHIGEIHNKSRGSITKKNSPKKDSSPYSNRIINKTMHNSKLKNNNLDKVNINNDNFIINKTYRNNQIERYINEDINIKLNKEEEKIKRLEQKQYLLDDEEDFNIDIIENINEPKSFRNTIESINKINNLEEKENNLNLKSSNLLKDFLFQINMDKYLGVLANNGFDDINLILEQSKNGGTSIQDNELKEAGISIPGDRAKILIRIQELSNNFSFPVPKEVYHTIEDLNKIDSDEHIQKLNKWLKNLKVEDYLINFIYSGYHSIELLLMQMISYNPLTSEMLKEEIGIDKIGYRSRIINKLKDESKGFLGHLQTKTLVINIGETNQNNCQCIIL